MTTDETTPQSAFTGNATIEPVEWFDYDEVDRLLGDVESSPVDARVQAAEMFSQLMNWIWATKGGAKTAIVRLMALTAALRPDLVGDKSYSQLAAELGVTKQALSKAVLNVSDKFGVRFARSRPESGRKNMAAKALGHANYNHGGYNRSASLTQ